MPRSPAPGTVGTAGSPRPGVPQQSVPRPAAPRPTASRARSAPPRPAAGRPSSSRPGARTGGADRRGPRAETVQQRLPRLFTVRALVMLVVLSIAFVLVFPTLRQYLDQQVQLEQLRAEVAAAEQANDDLQAELDRWSDPAYVEAQARSRLAFVMPGERALRVADPEVVPEEQPADEAPAGPATSADSDDPTRPWYARLWDSVQVAGVAGTGEAGGSAQDPEAGDNGSAPADGTPSPGDGAPDAEPTP
ncbi:septum formation initiator family protein [Cellulomonas sp. ES6]|uniref:septum formation initiator family protein n=1 Tax=Cellulomonas sp. ES6 TaxID=3039384 RepID=UPI0024B7A38A|nr:septum formation initiator family protein [Cellulomonas sp. ES6]WHP18712.1 septum formation initiator family protein [Cellulomonas sp. ES6]